MFRHCAISIPSLAVALIVLSAPAARAAGGMNLSWNECGVLGTLQRNFACDSNAGYNILVASATPPAPMPQLNGAATVFDLIVDEAALPSWWMLSGVGACRQGAITADFYFPGSTGCLDPWQGVAEGGVNYTALLFGEPNRARIRTVCGIPGTTAIDDLSEYYICRVAISNAHSAGAGACDGCGVGACIVFRELLLTQPLGVGDYRLLEAPLDRFYVTWQGGTMNHLCPEATPARTRTWGSIKSLYR